MSKLHELTLEVRENKAMRREAYSMSLYVAIVLLSALSVFDDSHPPTEGEVFLIEVGTTVGLVLAHGFAAWLSTKLLGDADEHIPPGDLLIVQIGGALAIGTAAMVAVLLAPTSVELQVARLTVAGWIAVLVFFESRTTHSTARAAALGLLALLAGVAVAALKAFLTH